MPPSPPPSPPPPAASAAFEPFKKVQEAVAALTQQLTQYYNGEGALRGGAVLSSDQDPRYIANREFLANKFARAFVWQDKFVISTMGSSVVAGHDNCNFDSYQRQMQRFLAPVFRTAGVDFQVRNAGQGGGCGDSHENMVWCTEHMLGSDTDIAHYSWTYFEHGPNSKEVHERWVRWVLAMPRAPAPMIWNAGGYSGADECAATSDPTGQLFDKYSGFGFNTVCLQTGIKALGYTGKEWGKVGNGLHTTTRYANTPADAFANYSDYATNKDKQREREQSLGVVFRNWHPGPLGFQAVADTFAFLYLHAMARGLSMVQAEVAKYSTYDAAVSALKRRWPLAPARVSLADLPAPVFCDPQLCSVATPPVCTSFELPVFGPRQVPVYSQQQWEGWQADDSPLLPPAEEANPLCKHLDHCGALTGSSSSGTLTFELPPLAVGRIIACCYNGRKDCGADFAAAGAKWFIDNQPLEGPFPQVLGKCVQIQESGGRSAASLLSLKVTDSSATLRLSHVMAV